MYSYEIGLDYQAKEHSITSVEQSFYQAGG